MSDAFRSCRGAFLAITVFSFIVNIMILTLPLYMFSMFDKVLTSFSMATLGMLFAMAVFAFGIQALVDIARSWVLIEVGNFLDRRLSARLLHASIANALHRGRERTAGPLQKFTMLRTFLTSQSIFSVMDAPWIPLFLLILFLMNPTVGIVAFVGAIFLFALALVNDRWSKEPLAQASMAINPALKLSNAAARNAEVVEAMGMTPTIVKAWHDGSEEANRYQSIASKRSAVISAISKWGRMVVQISVMTVAVMQMIQPGSTLTAGTMMASVILVGRALMPLEAMIGSYRNLLEAWASYKDLSGTLADMGERPRLSVLPPRPSGHISVEGVSYVVKNFDRPILSNVSFEIQPGEIIGVIGPSGAGKTTLAHLMVGLEKPTSGAVRLDGTDVYAWPSEDLGRYLGFLPQQVELFNTSVRDNICRFDPNADSDKIIRAAQLAGLHEIIQRLPREYDTNVGDAGSLMSGGQRQRIALARALYGHPLLVVLDEPNSNLDSEGEEALKNMLHAMKEQGTSVFLVAHRINVLQHVDKVLVLREGVVHKFAARDEVIAPVPTRPKIAVAEPSPGIPNRASS
ncbi:MAG: type I secretion system permease/ATPase [Alphaproteobacteria bacterium]|nr:type I secretion system permease/ATPase [Alphaproteobacteria bacterium]